MEHLTCFVAGNLALGVANGAVDGAKGAHYLGVAKNLTRTCFEMYNKMPTGAPAPDHHLWRQPPATGLMTVCSSRSINPLQQQGADPCSGTYLW